MEMDKLKKIIYGNKNVSVQDIKRFSTKLTEETTHTSVVSDLPKLIPAVFKYAMLEDKQYREAAIPALTELAGILDLNKHLKEKPWWTEMKGEILKSLDVLMSLVSTGDDQWSALWMTTVLMLGSNLRSELTLLNRLLKVVEKAFKMNDEEVRYQGFECWIKLIDNFSINSQEINNKRRLGLLVIPLKANNHNTPRLCASKMKTWKHLLSKLDQHNEMTVQLIVTHFLDFMFTGVGSIAPACKTLNAECADVFSRLLQTPLLFRILPELFIKYTFVCIEHIHRDLTLCLGIWEGLLDNMKNNQWAETHVTQLMSCLTGAGNNDKLGKSKTLAHMTRALYSGSHALPSGALVKHMKTVINLAMKPHVLVNYTEAWCNELLNIVAETDPIQLPHNIVGDIITKLNQLAVSEFFRDDKVKFLRGMWMTMTTIICKWLAEDGRIGKNGNVETDLHNIHDLLFFGAASLSSTWNKLQMKSWKAFYSECVKYFSLSTEVKCDKFVGDLVELLVEGVKDKKVPLHVGLDLVSIFLEFHLAKDESTILPLMMEVAVGTIDSFHTDTSGASALLSQYLKVILVAARSEPALVNNILTVTEKMLDSLEGTPLVEGHLEKTRNAILKAQIQLNNLKPCRSLDRSESPGTASVPPASSPTMTSFLHRLAKSKETKCKVGSPTSSQSSEVSSSPSTTPNSKKASSPFCDMKSEDFVFVPPKPRKILLTDHQKESLSTRKHDIPALYQDLSQDSSQSPFESIVAPIEVVNKEKAAVYSPKSFKEVNFKNLSPKKSEVSNSSTSEYKLQNNKENDCINNNTKSPVKSHSKENKISGGAEDAPLKVLQDDQRRSQDVSDSVETSKVVPANTRLRSRKSIVNDSNDSKSVIEVDEDSKTIGSDLNDRSKGSDSDCVKSAIHKTSNCNESNKEINITPNANGIEVTSKNTVHSEKASRLSSESQTPKRGSRLRKSRLSISVKKIIKKDDEEKNEEEKNISENLIPSERIKSPSGNTPKISPKRLRKRKSGVTPILTGGELIKRVRKSQTPSNNKDTPTNKNTKGNIKIKTPSNTIDEDKSCKKESSLVKITDTEPITQADITSEVKNKISKSNSRTEVDKSKTDSIPEISEKLMSVANTVENTRLTEISEIKSKDIPENGSEEIEIISIIDSDNEESCSDERENKKASMVLEDKSKKVSVKNDLLVRDNGAFIEVTLSPVKVVVERLPDIMITTKFETQGETGSSGGTVQSIEEVKSKSKLVKNITPSLDAMDQGVKNVQPPMKDTICINKTTNSDRKSVASEDKSISLSKPNTSAIKLNGTCIVTKDNGHEENLNKSNNVIVNKENKPLNTNESNESEHEENLSEKSRTEPTDISLTSRKTRSMDKSDQKLLDSEKRNEDESEDLIGKRTSLVSESKEVSADHKSTPAKEALSSEPLKFCVSSSNTSETNHSPSTLRKQKSAENTPVKSGQKQLKQTQLPFTPIRKTVVPESKSDTSSETVLSDKQNSPTKPDVKEETLPLLVLPNIGTSKTEEVQPSADEESNQVKSDKIKLDDELSPDDNMAENRQEVLRTPEKVNNTSTTLVICLERTEIVDVTTKTVVESPDKITESEDIIASSQETDINTSILVSCRNSSSSNSVKLQSKSPKKCENKLHSISSNERVLRSSPSKVENSRFSSTPVKKSVCRRLDVEIEESPEINEVIGTSDCTGEKSQAKKNTEEILNDFKLLNGNSKNVENNSLPPSRVSEIVNNLVDTPARADCSPKSHKNLKRFAESDEACLGSPKRPMSSLRFDSNNSPVSSPNSRTSQMMELAKQESEKTISSPISSIKKRRILPIRVGPLTRTPKSQIIHRTHSGPSEEWVRRTYSPSASPNSSILKRTQPIVSPDCSPPSSKKKRVSFLDPPVSESLLFSKANPGTGQIHRPELKLESESEELASQGSVGVELPETSNSDAKVFSPLKQCSSPLTDILERIVNQQWMSQLEAQLERLGVTTVGQLSSLPEETVQRLPFIQPKVERLRKILQNYYNEINEKPDDPRPLSCEESKEESHSENSKSKALIESPEKTVDKTNDILTNSSQNADEQTSVEDISTIAEDVKNKIEQYPELVNKLGNILHIDTAMKLLDIAVSKLKKENEKS